MPPDRIDQMGVVDRPVLVDPGVVVDQRVLVDQVVLVDQDDREVGVMDKVAAHRGPGALHRAVSACLVDDRGRVLLQRRALAKYHFAGRWSNTCCTHPRPRETGLDAIRRRVEEELGVEPLDLAHAGTFVYCAADPASGLVERELDHVFIGRVATDPVPDPAEVMDWRFVDPIAEHDWASPTYTPWLRDVLQLAGVLDRQVR
jgi:isopentenyl-diphosphate delta-isomerase